MAKFTQYALAASHEALGDAGWAPQSEEDQQATVSTVTCNGRATTTLKYVGCLSRFWYREL